MITCTFEDGGTSSLRHAVIDGIVLKDAKILLVKRAETLLEGGKWALVGGFVGRDEQLAEALQREIFEETGYRVSNITLLAINDNPDRPHEDRQNISFVFFCDAGKQEGESDWEVTDKQWFSFDELPKEEEVAFDHYQAIQLYIRYKKEAVSLPVLGGL
ncbi:MAG TPA: NUDIX hydrolase [Candidatus Acidoferrales bacterium]|nr:NUDIX hydrolase [Candidatus Acidoferrales bacterium]